MVSKSASLLQRMMKAVQVTEFGVPEVCKVATIAKPTVGPNQVLIQTKYSGINPVDTYIRSGTYARKPELPYTPGSDCAGTVDAVGEGVSTFKVGDPVFTVRTVTGTCAEYVLAENHVTFPLNTAKLTYEQGACLGVPFFTAYRALITRAQAKAGESVLIHGASGGVGTVCVQLAKHLGLKVFATAGTENGLKIVKECGADFTYNHRESDYTERLMADAGAEGVNIIVEMLANVNLQRDLEMISVSGRVVVVGCRGNIEISPRLTMGKESNIMGCMMGMNTLEEWKEAGEQAIKHQEQGWITPVVSNTKRYTLDTVSEAHVDVMSTSGASGNLVICTTT